MLPISMNMSIPLEGTPMETAEPRRFIRSLRSNEGKGTAGCLFSLLLLALATVAAIKVGPPYFAYRSLQADVKTEVSRAGAHFYDDETLIKGILDLARKNEIPLKREAIKVERFAGQLYIKIHYSVPVDFLVYQRDVDFDITAQSFIGRL